jgi:hypothetical protein
VLFYFLVERECVCFVAVVILLIIKKKVALKCAREMGGGLCASDGRRKRVCVCVCEARFIYIYFYRPTNLKVI